MLLTQDECALGNHFPIHGDGFGVAARCAVCARKFILQFENVGVVSAQDLFDRVNRILESDGENNKAAFARVYKSKLEDGTYLTGIQHYPGVLVFANRP